MASGFLIVLLERGANTPLAELNSWFDDDHLPARSDATLSATDAYLPGPPCTPVLVSNRCEH